MPRKYINLVLFTYMNIISKREPHFLFEIVPPPPSLPLPLGHAKNNPIKISAFRE